MITDNDLGTISFRQSTRAKRISVRIHADSLEVTLPAGSREKDALKFINEVRAKLKKKQTLITKKTVTISPNNYNPSISKPTTINNKSPNTKTYSTMKANLNKKH